MWISHILFLTSSKGESVPNGQFDVTGSHRNVSTTHCHPEKRSYNLELLRCNSSFEQITAQEIDWRRQSLILFFSPIGSQVSYRNECYLKVTSYSSRNWMLNCISQVLLWNKYLHYTETRSNQLFGVQWIKDIWIKICLLTCAKFCIL